MLSIINLKGHSVKIRICQYLLEKYTEEWCPVSSLKYLTKTKKKE